MKGILISIRQKWVELILNLIKKDEIRKGTAIGKAINKLIEEQGVAPTFIYCTHGKHLLDLRKEDTKDNYRLTNQSKSNNVLWSYPPLLNGKVVACFNATEEHIEYETCSRDISGWWKDDGKIYDHKDACLTYKEMFDYVGAGEGTVIHINDLEIFDKPKELKEFKTKLHIKGGCKNCPQNTGFSMPYCKTCDFLLPLTKAPQSWCYVEI